MFDAPRICIEIQSGIYIESQFTPDEKRVFVCTVIIQNLGIMSIQLIRRCRLITKRNGRAIEVHDG